LRSMLKPSYEIKIGSETYKPGPRSPVISIKVNLSMDIPADSVELLLGVDDDTKKIQRGDSVAVKLGYEDALKNVFFGEVDNVVPELSQVGVLGLSFAAKLLKRRINKTYEKQAAGDIVRDLAQIEKIETDKFSDGVRFPYYVVDDGRNLYEHMRELAGLSGFDLYLTNESKLVFRKYEKRDTHTLEYGKNIKTIEFDEDRPLTAGTVVQGESPSSFKGADTFHWLTKRAVEGVKGDEPRRLIIDLAVKDKETAEKVAESIQADTQRTLNGFVKIVGNADVKLGDAVEIKGMSNAKMNGSFQIRGAEHYLSKTAGFTTSIWWRK